MPIATHLTVGEIAELLDAPRWRIREIVDGLDVEIPRAGLYRLVPRQYLSENRERYSAFVALKDAKAAVRKSKRKKDAFHGLSAPTARTPPRPTRLSPGQLFQPLSIPGYHP